MTPQADGTRLGCLSPQLRAKIALKDPPRLEGFVERTTLFLLALHRTSAAELLDCLAEEPRGRARRWLQQLVHLDSATRQARLSLEFGPNREFDKKLERILRRAPPALRTALLHAVDRSRAGGAAPSDALSALAARLVHEARFG